MKYKIKNTKRAYYTVNDWISQLPKTNKKDLFKLFDWNQWDKDKNRIKDMYIELYDKKLDFYFSFAMSEHIEEIVNS